MLVLGVVFLFGISGGVGLFEFILLVLLFFVLEVELMVVVLVFCVVYYVILVVVVGVILFCLMVMGMEVFDCEVFCFDIIFIKDIVCVELGVVC